MAGKNLSFYNLTGGLNTVQDLFTINSTPNRTETPDMVNVEYYKLGGLKSMEGNSQIGTQFLHNGVPDKVTLGYEYQKGNNVYMVVTTFNGNCYMYDEKAKVFNKFYQFPSNTERHSITTYNGGIVITNGVDNLLYYALDRNKGLEGTVSTQVKDNKYIVTFEQDYITAQLQPGEVVEFVSNNKTVCYFKIVAITPQTQTEDDTPVITNATAEVQIALTLDDVINNVWLNTITDTYTEGTLTQTSYIIFKAQLINTDENNYIDPKDINGLAINSYKGRLWLGSNDGILYVSELGLLTFDIKYGAIAYDSFFEDTSKITALGIWSEYLVCHKHNGTYLVDANGDDTTNWSVKPYSEMSCESQQSFKSNDLGYFLFDRNNKGIYPLLSRSLYNTTYMGKELTVKINNVFQYLEYTKLDEIYVSYHPQRQYLNFYMNFIDGNGYSNKVYIYNILTKSWLFRQLPQQVTTAFEFDNNTYIGTKDGYVLKEFVGASFNGEPIEFSWTSPSYVWGGGTNKTTTKEFRLKLNNIDTNNFYIQSIRDGSSIDKKPRLITSNKNNGIALIWDTGYNFEDMVLDNTISNVYHYKAQDDKDYYSLTNALTSNNVKMYFDKNLTLYAGLNQDLFIETAGTIINYNYITYKDIPGYEWIGLNNFLKCYKSTKDSNFKAWISESDTSKAICNYKKEERITLYGYNIQRFHTDGRWYIFEYRFPKSIYEALIKYQSEGKTIVLSAEQNEIYRFYNGGWHKSQVSGSTTGYEALITNAYTAVGSNNYPFNFVGALRFKLPSGSYMDMPIKDDGAPELTRKEANDVKETFQEWNGKDTPEDGIEVVVDRYGLDSIVIDGEVFTRYAEGDYGQNSSFPVYTLTDLSEGQPIYGDNLRKKQISTIKEYVRDNPSGASYIVSEDDTIYYYKSKLTYNEPEYYLKEQLDFTFIDMVKGVVHYPYPKEEGRSLTDTSWGNNWVSDGYITKRFLLSNQYFETIQYKFFGSSLNDSMNIAGFEVDGIQINEVTW